MTPTPGKLPATAEAEAYYIAVAGLEETHPEAAITRAYQSGLEQWPADRNLLMGYGNLLYRQGEYAIAAQQFGSVIQHHSDYAPAWNNLAEILLLSGDIAQARTHAQQAVSLGGSFIDIYRATLSKIDRLDRR